MTIIDVRTTQEFVSGNVEGSLNIPLQELLNHIEEIKTLPEPIIFCCASGIRSEQAANYFKSLGVKCENAGSWRDVNP
jgi:rhodanese-related sulfurtransferase